MMDNCRSKERYGLFALEIRGERSKVHSSSSSEIDSNDEVLPWLLFLLLDPLPGEELDF